MQQRNSISVIIVNYNGGESVVECVGHVLASSMAVRVMVVDNASQDYSMAHLAEKFSGNPQLTLDYNAQNKGFAAAVNQGLRAHDGDYVLVLNPDCFIACDTLARFCALLDAHPQAGMAGGLVRNHDGSIQNACRRSVPTPWRSLVRVFHLDRFFGGIKRFDTLDTIPTSVESVDGISGACMFVRRSALHQVGPLDEEYFLHCEDLDWFMRFRAGGWQILFDPTIEITHIKGQCSTTQPLRVLWYKHRGMLRFYRKFFRHQYPVFLSWVVTCAVWTRFGVLAMETWIRKGLGHG